MNGLPTILSLPLYSPSAARTGRPRGVDDHAVDAAVGQVGEGQPDLVVGFLLDLAGVLDLVDLELAGGADLRADLLALQVGGVSTPFVSVRTTRIWPALR